MRTIDLRHWQRESIVRNFFFLGMLIAFFGSISAWFMWPLADKYTILSSLCLGFSMLVANLLKEKFYCRKDFILPTLFCTLLIYYQIFTKGMGINTYIVYIFYVFTFYAIFRVRISEIRRFVDLMAKGMGAFLIISMFFFLLYILGFPLPSRDAEYADMYSFTNYYLFLIDDRNLFVIIPRFQSIFVEPGHMGTMTALLLFTQTGKWKKWYNISLLIATLISFSLAAYGLLVGIIFLGLWVRGQLIFKKAMFAVIILGAITIGSFYYNDGNNMLHDLIMLRLEVDDGELAGDNRVTDDFLTEYESFLQSSDILTGRDRNEEIFGNSGYRVYFYDYGLIGLLLVIIFYVFSMYEPHNHKAFIAVLIIATINFIIRAYPLWYSNFIPLFFVANNYLENDDDNDKYTS